MPFPYYSVKSISLVKDFSYLTGTDCTTTFADSETEVHKAKKKRAMDTILEAARWPRSVLMAPMV